MGRSDRGGPKGRGRSAPGQTYFASTVTGAEAALEHEVRRLGARGVRRLPGGVSFQGDRRLMVRACLTLRCANRVLWNLGAFRALDGEGLYRGVRQVADWSALVPPDKTLAVHATARDNDGLRDGRYVALKVKDAIVDAVREQHGERPSVDTSDPHVRVHVRVVGERIRISLDASGVLGLHARGYRVEAGEAPLRETVAAAIIDATRWRGDRPLLDPMCGSGTLLIEGALRGTETAPGLVGRGYGFERWQGYRPDLLEAVRSEARDVVRALPSRVYGVDRDAAMVRIAEANVRRAGMEASVSLRVGAVRDLTNPEPDGLEGVLVTNPPWGARMGDLRGVKRLMGELGGTLGTRFRGWSAWVLLPEAEMARATGLRVVKALPLRVGPMDLVIVQLDVPPRV